MVMVMGDGDGDGRDSHEHGHEYGDGSMVSSEIARQFCGDQTDGHFAFVIA